ncbi:MAG: XRE family transcriptional regulator [Deltaproteobacteria bacterium]|nr:XRE family transcriptional regulator [Deltaproteobacteria bacterium]
MGKTQADVALASQIDQADVSRLESRGTLDDCQVATLRRYLEAVGGGLELVATFGSKKIVVVGVQGASSPANTAVQRTGRRPARR